MASPTEGSVALKRVCERSTFAAVGKLIGASESAVRHYTTGRRTPAEEVRVRIQTVHGISAGLWDVRIAVVAPVAPPVQAEEPSAAAEDPLDAHSVAEETVRTLRGQLAKLDADPEATSRERASVSTALTSATRLLARTSGSFEVTQATILRSPHWVALKAAIVDALAPVPGALDAMQKALEVYEG